MAGTGLRQYLFNSNFSPVPNGERSFRLPVFKPFTITEVRIDIFCLHKIECLILTQIVPFASDNFLNDIQIKSLAVDLNAFDGSKDGAAHFVVDYERLTTGDHDGTQHADREIDHVGTCLCGHRNCIAFLEPRLCIREFCISHASGDCRW